MPSLKEYKDKLSSLGNIKKMTHTMKLVSASKLRQAQEAEANARNYAQELKALISRLEASVESHEHPLFTPKEKIEKVFLLVITSDKGLCGGFNNNLTRQVLPWIKEYQAENKIVDVATCGKRGYMFLKSKENVVKNFVDMTAKPSFNDALHIGKELSDSFTSDEYDEIYLSYNQYFNPITQTPIFEKILPIQAESLVEGGDMISSDYIFEPKKKDLLKFLIPRYLYFRIYYALLENSAGEHGARMTAMDNATENAKDLINEYTLLRNRARQAAITTELTEIVAGAEALK